MGLMGIWTSVNCKVHSKLECKTVMVMSWVLYLFDSTIHQVYWITSHKTSMPKSGA